MTALTNRVGDCLLLLAMALFFGELTLNYYLESSDFSIELNFWLILVVLITAFTKRAQIPFSAWLPAAIAAPTPVSSLVHSSTLVTAGVYLLIRFNLFIPPFGFSLVLIVGLLTITIASLSALFETDIKKIVALSTLRQLGLIISAIGLGSFELAFFHLLTHAYFKALLFIRVGNFIHLRGGNQDLRFITLKDRILGWTLSLSIIANMRLIGWPFFRGFYSKDFIVELLLFSKISIVEFVLIILTLFFTASYTARFILSTSLTLNKSPSLISIADNDLKIITGIITLFPLAFMGGALIY